MLRSLYNGDISYRAVSSGLRGSIPPGSARAGDAAPAEACALGYAFVGVALGFGGGMGMCVTPAG